MNKRLGKIAVWTAAIIVAGIAVYTILVLFGCPPILAAAMVAVLCSAVVLGWLTEAMYRKSFPNLFRKFDKRDERPKP